MGWRGLKGVIIGMLILAGGLGRPAPGLGARGAAESTPSNRVFLPLVLRSPTVTAPPLEWLPRLNAYRAMAGLPSRSASIRIPWSIVVTRPPPGSPS
jgi:hypothetical protein